MEGSEEIRGVWDHVWLCLGTLRALFGGQKGCGFYQICRWFDSHAKSAIFSWLQATDGQLSLPPNWYIDTAHALLHMVHAAVPTVHAAVPTAVLKYDSLEEQVTCGGTCVR